MPLGTYRKGALIIESIPKRYVLTYSYHPYQNPDTPKTTIFMGYTDDKSEIPELIDRLVDLGYMKREDFDYWDIIDDESYQPSK